MHPQPLFVTGTARSGSTLVCHLLSAHPGIALASDPFLELFRSFRTAVLAGSGSVDADKPLSDYYFTPTGPAALDAILNADLELTVDETQWPGIISRTKARAAHESADLVGRVDGVRSRTYRDAFGRALEIVARARDAERSAWVGFKDVWIPEFFRPLARAFPDARFVYVQRDPRAVLASAIGTDEPGARTHVLSYLRHWRKGVALCLHFEADAAMAQRFRVLPYERLVADPDSEARALCAWLGVPFDPAMLESDNYVAYSQPAGAPWPGNSSFTDALGGITASSTSRWRTALPAPVVAAADLVCGPDMLVAGYEPATPGASPEADALPFLIENGNDEGLAWRSDSGDSMTECGLELLRRAALGSSGEALGADVVRRCFLFEHVFDHLRNAGSLEVR